MAELISKLIAYLRGMWRFRWLALAVAWVVAMMGWYHVYSMPDQYRSRAQVYVDTESVLRPLLPGNPRGTDVMSEVELMTRALMSRPNLLDVAQKTDLDLRAGTDREMDNLINRMKSKLEIRSVGKSLYTIAFRDHEPEVTRNVVQTLLGSFVSDTLREGREKNDEAMEFIETKISDYEQRLAEAEQRLADFKKRNVGLMPGDSGGYYQRLETALTKQKELDREIALQIGTRDELLSQLDGEEPTFGIARPNTPTSGPSGSSYDAQIQLIDSDLSQLRLQFTDKHPDVVALLSRRDNMIKKRDEELALLAGNMESDLPAFDPLDLNPVYQQLRSQLSLVNVELKQLQTKRTQQRRVVNELQRSVDIVPEVEAELAALNRDYEVTKARHDALLQSLEDARLGGEAESSVSDVRFRVIEPPRLPLEPYGPNRPVFLTMTLLAALGAGIAVSFLLDQLRPVFITRDDLAAKSGLPVLGAIGVVMMPHQSFMMRIQKAGFLAGLLGLLFVYAVVVVFESGILRVIESISLSLGL
ncbi:MAG: XrtA system polysaccharide chain length determinant [Gammaproteobacteria bacterium]